jgi:hypothetical protein
VVAAESLADAFAELVAKLDIDLIFETKVYIARAKTYRKIAQ